MEVIVNALGSEIPVIKIEPRSQSQDLCLLNYQGYQYPQSYRSDWSTTANPPSSHQPIQFASPALDHRQGFQAAAEAISAQGFYNDGYFSTNRPAVSAEIPENINIDVRAERARTSDGNVASVAQLHNLTKQAKSQFLPAGNYEQHLPHEVVNRHFSNSLYRPLHTSSHLHRSVQNSLDHPNSTMSLSYGVESRSYMPADANYPQMQLHDQEQEEIQHEHTRYPSPPIPTSEMNPYNAQAIDVAQDDAIENLPNLQNHHESDAPSPGRSKPIPKPDREITKGENGRYVCTWLGCTEDVRDFGRKCEWSKHMDKHDRPYKCPAEGCEKLPGFTYSGGLLRHEREVHGKHGGPRKQLNCPHLNCKRHTGKGFSRQENLNEHLRRVHTSDSVIPDGAETEEEGSDSKTGMKRKRGSGGRGSGDDVRDEVKRLRAENEELRRHSEAQAAQIAEIMAQLRQLPSTMQPRMPNAPMM